MIGQECHLASIDLETPLTKIRNVTHTVYAVSLSISDSDTDALLDTSLQGCTSHVFSNFAEAQEVCEKLPQSKGFMIHEFLMSGFRFTLMSLVVKAKKIESL